MASSITRNLVKKFQRARWIIDDDLYVDTDRLCKVLGTRPIDYSETAYAMFAQLREYGFSPKEIDEAHIVDIYAVLLGSNTDMSLTGGKGTNPSPDDVEWTRPMGKAEAARYLDCPSSKKADWINNCVKDGSIKMKTLTRQSHQFDIEDFPRQHRDKVKANSEK